MRMGCPSLSRSSAATSSAGTVGATLPGGNAHAWQIDGLRCPALGSTGQDSPAGHPLVAWLCAARHGSAPPTPKVPGPPPPPTPTYTPGQQARGDAGGGRLEQLDAAVGLLPVRRGGQPVLLSQGVRHLALLAWHGRQALPAPGSMGGRHPCPAGDVLQHKGQRCSCTRGAQGCALPLPYAPPSTHRLDDLSAMKAASCLSSLHSVGGGGIEGARALLRQVTRAAAQPCALGMLVQGRAERVATEPCVDLRPWQLTPPQTWGAAAPPPAGDRYRWRCCTGPR